MASISYFRLDDTLNPYDELSNIFSWLSKLNLFINPLVIIVISVIAIEWFKIKRQYEKRISNRDIYFYFINSILFICYFIAGISLYPHLDNLDINQQFYQILFFSLLVIVLTLYIRYFSYSTKMNPILDNLDKETMIIVNEIKEKIRLNERKIDELTLNIVEHVKVQIEQEYDLNTLDDYHTKVPRYISQRPFRKVGDRHDEYQPTEELEILTNYVTEMDKGSFGIAGVRGFGKTALMKAIENNLERKNSKNYVTVWLSAPTAISEGNIFTKRPC